MRGTGRAQGDGGGREAGRREGDGGRGGGGGRREGGGRRGGEGKEVLGSGGKRTGGRGVGEGEGKGTAIDRITGDSVYQMPATCMFITCCRFTCSQHPSRSVGGSTANRHTTRRTIPR